MYVSCLVSTFATIYSGSNLQKLCCYPVPDTLGIAVCRCSDGRASVSQTPAWPLCRPLSGPRITSCLECIPFCLVRLLSTVWPRVSHIRSLCRPLPDTRFFHCLVRLSPTVQSVLVDITLRLLGVDLLPTLPTRPAVRRSPGRRLG